jgi:ribonuclease HI
VDTQYAGVFYTDGGYHPIRALGGWGVHGYCYRETPFHGKTGQKHWCVSAQGYQRLTDETPCTEVDVSIYIDAFGGLFDPVTNNRAELQAMLEALKLIEQHRLTQAWVYSDSQYVVQGINQYLPNWVNAGWVKRDGDTLVNQDLWQALNTQLAKVHTQCVLTIEWIKGHASRLSELDYDLLGNQLADRLATAGIMQARCGYHTPIVTTTPAKKYWTPSAYRHPLLIHGRWYFNTAQILADYTDTGHRLYYFGNHGNDDDFLGKRMNDASFSVLMTQQEEPVLESIRTIEQCLDVNAFNSLMIGRLDHIFKPVVYQALQRHQGWCVQQKTQKLDLYTFDELQLTKELRPPRLAFNLIEVMEILEGLLHSVVFEHALPGVMVNDVTEQFYTLSAGKKPKRTLVESLDQSKKGHTVVVHHPINEQPVDIELILGLDCPPRATLSKLATQHPRLSVLTWRESTNAFRYATCMQHHTDAAIYAGFYSNLVFIKKRQPHDR